MRNAAKLAAAVVALGLLGWIASTGLVAWGLTRRHGPITAETAPIPAAAEAHRIETEDGVTLGAWLARASAPEQPCALLLHGNGGTRADMRSIFRRLAADGRCVLAITLRAHGDSGGLSNDFGYGAAADVEAAVAFLARAQPGRRVVVVGRSLGAAAALYAAERLGDRVHGYFLEQPYKDLASATENRLRMFLPAMLRDPVYAGLMLWARAFIDAPVDALSPVAAAAKVPPGIPVVVVTGDADRHATLDDVRAVFAPLASRGELVIFPGAEHVPLDLYDGALYFAAFDRLAARARAR